MEARAERRGGRADAVRAQKQALKIGSIPGGQHAQILSESHRSIRDGGYSADYEELGIR